MSDIKEPTLIEMSLWSRPWFRLTFSVFLKTHYQLRRAIFFMAVVHLHQRFSLRVIKTGIFSSPAPTLPPSGVKVTLIEDDTALVSWKLPDEPNLAVTRYTILYASRKAWVAGEWKVLQREGEPKRECEKERERGAAG